MGSGQFIRFWVLLCTQAHGTSFLAEALLMQCSCYSQRDGRVGSSLGSQLGQGPMDALSMHTSWVEFTCHHFPTAGVSGDLSEGWNVIAFDFGSGTFDRHGLLSASPLPA